VDGTGEKEYHLDRKVTTLLLTSEIPAVALKCSLEARFTEKVPIWYQLILKAF
jgi:hypothetical protein